MINTILLATVITFSNYIPVTEYSFGPETTLGPDSYIYQDRCIIKEFTLNNKGVMSVTCNITTDDVPVEQLKMENSE